MHRFLAALVVLIQAGHALGADCAGGSVRSLRVSPARVAFTGTVTRAGLTHTTAVAGGLELVLEDASTGAVVYRTTLPAERFVTRPDATTYDGAGTFAGSVRLRGTRRQADTVRVTLRDTRPTFSAPLSDGPLRARLTIGGGCARTCVADCTRRGAGLGCRRSLDYVPFPDAGFGALGGGPAGRARRTAACRSTPRSAATS